MTASGVSDIQDTRHEQVGTTRIVWALALVVIPGLLIPGAGLIVAGYLAYRPLRHAGRLRWLLLALGALLLLGDIGVLSFPVQPSIPPHDGFPHPA